MPGISLKVLRTSFAMAHSRSISGCVTCSTAPASSLRRARSRYGANGHGIVGPNGPALGYSCPPYAAPAPSALVRHGERGKRPRERV